MNKAIFAKSVFLVGITSIFISFLKFILMPILSKYLGVEHYGVWSNIQNTVWLLGALSSFGMGAAITRFLSNKKDDYIVKRDFLMILSSITIFSLFFICLNILISDMISIHIFKNIKYSPFVSVGSLLITLTVLMNIFFIFFRTLRKYRWYSLSFISYSILEVLLIWYFLYIGHGLKSVILITIILKSIFIFVYFLFEFRSSGLILPNFSSFGKYFKFGFPLSIVPLYTWLIRVSDQYVVGFFMGPVFLGIYSLNYSLSYLITNLPTVLLFVLVPLLTRFWDSRDMVKFDEFFNYSYKYMLLIVIPFIFGLVVLYKPILLVLSNETFFAGYDTIIVLSAAMLLSCVYYLHSQILLLTKETGKVSFIMMVSSLFNILLNIILVPIIGIVGAALSTLFTFLIMNIFNYIFCVKTYRFNFMFGFVIKSVFSSLLMSFAVSIFNTHNFFGLMLNILFGVIVYFLIMYALNAIRISEIKFFISLFLSKFNR